MLTEVPEQVKGRRRPAAGGYPRGEETRRRILEQAVQVFADQGYAQASTRAIAQRAGVRQPAIQYHFGGKRQLHLACADHIADEICLRLDPALAAAQPLNGDATDADAARSALAHIAGTLVRILVHGEQAAAWAPFILREQAAPTAAFEILYRRVMSKVSALCGVLIGRCRGLPPEHEEVRLLTLSFIGQILVFRVAREASLRILGWTDFDGNRLDRLGAFVTRNTMEAICVAPGGRQ